MMRKFGLQSLALLLALGLFIVGAHAQSSTVGSVSGQVKDPQGGAVPNAEVTFKEETTGASRTATTAAAPGRSTTAIPSSNTVAVIRDCSGTNRASAG